MKVRIEMEIDVPEELLLGDGSFEETMGENVLMAIPKFHLQQGINAAKNLETMQRIDPSSPITDSWKYILDRREKWAAVFDTATFAATKASS